jgi:formate hydrogenlyase subunit 4
MIHEGMVLEYAGPYLGLIVWSHDIKQLLMLSLLANLALPVWVLSPVWLALPVFLIKTLLLGVLLACIETAMAKVRILKIPDLLITATALSALAVLSGLPLGR